MSVIMNPFARMQCDMDRKVASFVDTPKPELDPTKLVTIDTDIKSACMELTMDMLKKLHRISDPITYPNVARYMMMVASMSPIKCICVGISPYENGILPTFAGAMSYSPLTCIGCTPSVQVLSQVMSLVAVMIKKAFVSKSKNVDASKIPTRDEYTARFAMMLRCSYSCLAAGVAFVNASPVITSNTAKRVRAASIFSEWVGGMIEIHTRNQYKLTIVSMGALAESSMNDVFKSYQGAKSNISYTKTSNPAMLQHMNVSKSEEPTPINNAITNQERALDEIMGNNPGMTVKASFQWYAYSDELLLTVVKERSIMHMTRLLVDEAPEQLLDTFLNTVLNIITKPNMESLMGAITNIRLHEDPAPVDNRSATSGFNPFDNQNMMMQASSQAVAQPTTPVNPFLSAINEANTAADTRTNTGPNPNTEMSQGPPMVTKRSTIGQMIDPSGKAVSHHVIVLDSMIRTLSETLTGYKDIQSDLAQLLIRQAKTYAALKDNRIRTPEEVEELQEYLDSFAEFCTNMTTNMEKAYGVVAALPAVVEGDRGVYEHETHPVGPLMRRSDGSTMKDYVYTEIRANANRTQEINSAMGENTEQYTNAVPPVQMVPGPSMVPPPPQQMSTSTPVMMQQNMAQPTVISASSGGFNPFEVALGIAPAQVMPTIVDLSTTGDSSMFQGAKQFVYECADEMLDEAEGEDDEELFAASMDLMRDTDWHGMTFKNVPAEKIALYFTIETAKGDMCVLDCLSLIVAEYMSIHNGEKPSKEMMEKIFEVLNTDDEDRAGFIRMLPNWIKSSTSAMELMDMMNESEDEESGSDESEDEEE
jgi:hypothetical protein